MAGHASIDCECATAHPGPRLWDIAYAVYRSAPLSRHIAVESIVTIKEQINRARDFPDAYGLPADERAALPDLVIERLKGLVAFLEAEVARGSEKYRKDIEEGHHRLFREDIAFIGIKSRPDSWPVDEPATRRSGESCHKAAARWSTDRLPIAAPKTPESHIVAGSFLNPNRRPRQYVAVHATTEE